MPPYTTLWPTNIRTVSACGQYGAAFPINPPLVEVGIHVDKPNEPEHESYWLKEEVKYRLGATYQCIIALAIRPCRFTRDREPTRIEIQVMVFQWVTRALYKLTKEPYFYITPDNQYQPSFVIEVGCSESHRWLVDDMRLWMMGGRPHVKIVLIIKFARMARTNEVTGKAELYVCDVSGNPFCQQKAASSPEATTKCRGFMVLRSEHRASWLNPHRVRAIISL
jgi:hypothetical protein